MKRLLSLLLIATMLLTLMGCQAEKNEDSKIQSSANINPNSTTTSPAMLKIGVMSDVGAIPFIIAQEQGYFSNKNLPVEITVFRSAVDRDTALQTANLDCAMGDMLTILLYNESGFGAKMIGQTYGNYKLISEPNLSAENFLKSDTLSIGISSNTVIDFATEQISESKAISSKVDKIAIPQMPVRLEMLKAGELKGATLPEPLASAAVLEGGAVIGSTAEMSLYPGIFIASDATIQDKSQSLQLMYEAYNEAVDYLNSTPSSEYYASLVTELGFPPILEDQFEMPLFEHVIAPDEKTFGITLEWMQKNELVKKDFEYNSLTNFEFLPAN